MKRRLKSINAFKELQERLITDRDPDIPVIVIPAGTCGQASGANDLIRIAKRELLAGGLVDKIHLRITGCHGCCQLEPSILVEPGRTLYPKVTQDAMVRIMEAVATGAVLEDLLFVDTTTGKTIEKHDDIPFYKGQTRTILSRGEKVDPIRIYTYIENGGYQALTKVLSKANPQWVIDEVKASGLRGRGGGGFPTGVKWEMLAKQNGTRGKFLVCNADEGDPGAYMDRSLLEGNPHSIIEGMLIGAYGTGAPEGVIYVRNEYPYAIKHLLIALRQARELGLLGENILGSGFSFEIKLVKGAGAFVCGEETALIASIEGRIGEPRQRPPFPIKKGINGRPTVINNVETWANIPVIIESGAARFRAVGTEKSTGTKIFSLVGKVKYNGLVEVPMGISIEDIVYGIGGGPGGKAKIKGVQTGGPSGGCIPAHRFDLPIDYDSLAGAGSIMGSGGMIVMDENTCMVDIVRYYMNFLKDESCGKCFTCRKGTQRMYEILDNITKGRAVISDLNTLEELALVVKDTTMCGLGQTSSNPVLSTLKYFRHEYEDHILRNKCSALVCKDLVGAPCQAACPLGTEAWRYISHIARSENEEAYKVIREANPFPSVCARVCSHPCEERCRACTTGNQAVSVRSLKRFIVDRVDPSVYTPERSEDKKHRVAIIGSGPAGLTAAYYLSLKGYHPTVFEADPKPGGMLVSGIPAYRLPRENLSKEINSLLADKVTLKLNTVLGRDMTLDSLLEEGFKAIFLALGAHRSLKLNLEGEDAAGIYPSIKFLKTFNLQGKNLAEGRVGIIGGGNSALDAARVAVRQENVKSVTVFYRRTRHEMPAYEEEIEAALQEGVELRTLAAPVKIHLREGRLTGVEFIDNKPGERDSSGRRKPVPIPGSEQLVPLDTLIVAISEKPDIDFISSMGIGISAGGALVADPETSETARPGVFAGGDVVTGPGKVVDAIAAGKNVSVMIDRYLKGEPLRQRPPLCLPQVYVEPVTLSEEETGKALRAIPPVISVEARKLNFNEVERPLPENEAIGEARRCLRCDLEFTDPAKDESAISAVGGNKA
ncbi:MAG: NADH-ubiquinone oxidoreductase-F iron-sulfur binding region domain-containing protein [Candidatus Eremiobacteraeota bacterium]|nr:NADH-ubiquinone oxidoreductase-F iron-sulfur binding region domain-containing protein [Candidatus Eremiobacteraeota bacterium]